MLVERSGIMRIFTRYVCHNRSHRCCSFASKAVSRFFAQVWTFVLQQNHHLWGYEVNQTDLVDTTQAILMTYDNVNDTSGKCFGVIRGGVLLTLSCAISGQ